MKKLLSLILLSALITSCATEKIAPVGVIKKINSHSEAIISYPESNLNQGDSVKLIRVFWTMGRRNETLVMNGIVSNKVGNDLYDVKFDGSKSISETNIIRK